MNYREIRTLRSNSGKKIKTALAELFKIVIFAFCFGMWRSPVSAHAWGAWGRRFKSCHPDLTKSDSEMNHFFYF